jgi:hypothetical protein
LGGGSGGGIYNANTNDVPLRNCLIAQNQNSSVGGLSFAEAISQNLRRVALTAQRGGDSVLRAWEQNGQSWCVPFVELI